MPRPNDAFPDGRASKSAGSCIWWRFARIAGHVMLSDWGFFAAAFAVRSPSFVPAVSVFGP
jgi:hypothetical protein